MWALRRASLSLRNQGFSIEALRVPFSNSELVPVKRNLSSNADEFSQPSEKLEEIKGDEATAKSASAGKLIKKLVNFRMKEGKRTRTRAIAYETFHRLARAERNVLDVLVDAVENVKPVCEVAKVGVAGSVYDVPGIVDRDRQETLAIRWILDAASRRRGSYKVSLEKSLVDELLDASRKRGFARKKRDNIHKLAADNRSFAHFRWW